MAASTSTDAGRLDHETSEEEFAALIDRARRELDRQLLLELLPERIPVYQGRSANTVTRMRGYLLAAFEEAGLPEGALPYVLEELESGRNAYLVAAAARALRGRESRSSDAVPFLLKAIANIAYADDAVSFDSYRPSWPLSGHTTALQEICTTVACLGSEATVALPALRSLLEQPGVLSDAARIKLESAVSKLSAGGSCVRRPGAFHLLCTRPGKRPPCHSRHPTSSRRARRRGAGRPGRRSGDIRGVLHRQALGSRVLLHALRQPQQVLAHDHQAGTAPRAACRRRPGRPDPYCGDHLRP